MAKLTPEKLAQAIALQEAGRTQTEIAAALGVAHKTVNRHLRAHNLAVAAALESEAKEERVRQVGQLQWMLSQALRGWEKSLKNAATVKVTTGGKGGDRTERTLKAQSGNPAHLTAAVAILTSLQKLFRLDAEADDPAASEAAARGQVAGVILGALADLPDDVRTLVGERLAAALMEPPRARGH